MSTHTKLPKRPYVMVARLAKAAATRNRIRDSAMQLYAERSLDDFTLEDVASRAATTVQTLLRLFKSKDNLILEAMQSQQIPPRVTRAGDADLAISIIVEIYESIGDITIQRLSDERRLPALKPGIDLGRRHHREWVRTVFGPQIERRDGADRARLLNGLIVATDVYTWKILRRDEGLDREAAERVMRAMARALISFEGD